MTFPMYITDKVLVTGTPNRNYSDRRRIYTQWPQGQLHISPILNQSPDGKLLGSNVWHTHISNAQIITYKYRNQGIQGCKTTWANFRSIPIRGSESQLDNDITFTEWIPSRGGASRIFGRGVPLAKLQTCPCLRKMDWKSYPYLWNTMWNKTRVYSKYANKKCCLEVQFIRF